VQIIPATDVLDGSVVRLTKGRFDDITVYASDAVALLRRFADEGAELVHVVDLAGARDGTANSALWSALGASGVPFQLGGGIRTVARASEVIACGAIRAVVGTAAVWEPGTVAGMVTTLGSDRIVAALDVAGGKATGAGWLDEGRELEAVAAGLVGAGVARALVTGIARDGTMSGPDVDVLARVAALAPEMALIASGGVGTLDDLRTLRDSGVEAAIVGRALYEGRFTLADAIAASR
jgi:phosphoribosylformimino-5-aminoimidazole carboxamide ribotide isomerase